MRYITAGDGPAVVLLHGWSDSKEVWRATMRALAPAMHVCAPDLPGHGESPLDGATGLRQVAERIGLLCDALGLDAITLVGHSMGGNVAAELALIRPELVHRLVLVAPAIYAAELPTFTRLCLSELVGWPALRLWLAASGGLGGVRGSPPDPASLRQMLAMLFASDIPGRLTEIRTPTLVVTGALDLMVPARVSRRVTRDIPGARFALLPRSAHHPMVEQPADFAGALLAFTQATTPLT
jgi:pimeloyl-ACP methyl ester carboxylesterase